MNLILSSVGDNSCHRSWLGGNYDIILIYYGNNEQVYAEYCKGVKQCIRKKGQKFPLLAKFIDENLELIKSYEYVWLPDDDIEISHLKIDKMFDMANKYSLYLCQPAVRGADNEVSHYITRPQPSTIRFTNFVEVMAPLFSLSSLLKVYSDFYYSESGWGLDLTWSHILGNPVDKIAIIDAIVMVHTKPIGTDYSRFKKSPQYEQNALLNKYKISLVHTNYKSIYE